MRVPGAVIIGGHVNGLGLARALAARNLPTAVLTTKPFDVAQHSRWISGHDTLLQIEEHPEQLVELLERRAHDWRGWALFPANDGALAALARHRDQLSSTHRVIAPPAEIAGCFLDKERMLEIARAVGVDMPHCYGPAVPATAALPQIRFPVIVKPSVGYRFFSRFNCKLFVARDRGELNGCISRLVDAGMRGQVFDLIPGPDSQIHAYCTYVGARGEPRGGLTVRKLRQGPPLYGVARVAEITEDNPALRDATIEILRRSGFRGMAVAEFKLDPRDGRFRFLEINGRSVIYNALLWRGGLDLAGLAWSDQVDGQPETARSNHWPGVWVHLHADILHRLLRRRSELSGLRDFVAPYGRPKVYAVWSASDPLPFVAEWSRTMRAGVSSAWRAAYRRIAGRGAGSPSGT